MKPTPVNQTSQVLVSRDDGGNVRLTLITALAPIEASISIQESSLLAHALLSAPLAKNGQALKKYTPPGSLPSQDEFMRQRAIIKNRGLLDESQEQWERAYV